MFDSLFVQNKATEVVGARLPLEAAQWDEFILNQLGNIIDLSKYNINVEYKKADYKKGNAVGSITIKIGDKSAYIPLIIHDFYLQPLDIFYFKTKGFPLRADLLSEFLSDKLLMLKTVDKRKMFPSYHSIEGTNLLRKFSCTKEEKEQLMKNASEDIKKKIETIPLEPEQTNFNKLAYLFLDKIGFDKYLMKYAFDKDSLLALQEKTLNYKQASNIFEKIGKNIDNISLPLKITYPYDQSYEERRKQREPKLELDFEDLKKGGIVLTNEGKVDSGRIFPLIDADANIKGKIFIGRKGYGIAKKFMGYKLGKFNALAGRVEYQRKRPPGRNISPRKGDKFIFIFYIGGKNFAGIPKEKLRYWQTEDEDDAVAMGPFEYAYAKKIGNETRYYATKNLNVLEFIVTTGDKFMENLIEKKNNSFYIPKPILCRLDGPQLNYIASSKGLKNKLALWNPYLKVTKIASDKFMMKLGEEKKIVSKVEKDLILARLAKKKSDEPIFKEILGTEAKKEEKEQEKDKTQKKEKTKEAVLKIKSDLDEFLKIAEEMHFDEGVDAALTLNLLTPQRIQKFIDAIPDFERILNLSVDMLLAARLGEKRINSDTLKMLIDKLYNTIEILETLRR